MRLPVKEGPPLYTVVRRKSGRTVHINILDVPSRTMMAWLNRKGCEEQVVPHEVMLTQCTLNAESDPLSVCAIFHTHTIKKKKLKSD